jgi:hypothetical protein
MDNQDLNGLLRDVAAKLDSLPKAIDETQVRQIVENVIASEKQVSAAEAEAGRKMKFANVTPASLVGTKYARHGFSEADIEMLYDVMNAAKAAGVSQGPTEELRKCFETVSSALYISDAEIRSIDKTALDNMFPRVRKGIASGAELQAYAKAMDSAETGYGLQLMGAQYVADLWEAARPLSKVFPLIDTFEMTAPTAYLPVEADIPEMLFVAESTANNSANYATSKTGSNRVQVDAKKFVIHQMWSSELEEDAIIPFIPYLRRQAAVAIAHFSDSLILNGDTTGTSTGNINLDDGTPGATKHYLAFDGLRHIGLVDNTANSKDAGGAVSYALLREQLTRMEDVTNLFHWGMPINPEDVVYITDHKTANAISQLDEVLTVDKYGPQATVLTGELAKVGRNPLIASMAMSLTEADGKVSTTGSNNIKGQVVCFNRRGLKAGWRRRVRVEVERLPASDQTRIVYSLRMGLGRYSGTGAATGIEMADVLRNISL